MSRHAVVSPDGIVVSVCEWTGDGWYAPKDHIIVSSEICDIGDRYDVATHTFSRIQQPGSVCPKNILNGENPRWKGSESPQKWFMANDKGEIINLVIGCGKYEYKPFPAKQWVCKRDESVSFEHRYDHQQDRCVTK